MLQGLCCEPESQFTTHTCVGALDVTASEETPNSFVLPPRHPGALTSFRGCSYSSVFIATRCPGHLGSSL